MGMSLPSRADPPPCTIPQRGREQNEKCGLEEIIDIHEADRNEGQNGREDASDRRVDHSPHGITNRWCPVSPGNPVVLGWRRDTPLTREHPCDAPLRGETNVRKTALYWLGNSATVVATAMLLAACGNDVPVGPSPRATLATLATLTAAAQTGDLTSVAAAANSVTDNRAPDLGACDSLRVPTGNKVAFRAFAKGVQIYRWSGTSWIFVEPSATLSADAQGKSTIATHFAGPTWQSVSGGKVVGSVLKRCTPNPSAIAWLLLAAVPDDGPGIFQRTKYIQRVNTVGGNAPSLPGTVTGDLASVPYTAEYVFYRPQ